MINGPAEFMETDVLIIGGGLAGTRAAIASHGQEARVTLVMKRKFGQGGSSAFPGWVGAFNVARGTESAEEEIKEIIRAAAGLCDEKLAKILAYESEDRLNDLERWGLGTVSKAGGRYSQVTGCFANQPRNITAAGLGIAPRMLTVLRQQVRKRNIELIDDVMIVSLLTHRGDCVGAIGVNKRGRIFVFQAKSTVLATGGAAALFGPLSLCPHDATGDGYALGFHAGAEMYNMEFIQILPVTGEILIVLLLLYPDIYNKFGDRFLPRYLPNGITLEECFAQRARNHPFSTANNGKFLDIAIYKEIFEGRGTENMSVYVDFTKLPEEAVKKSIEETKGGPFGGVKAGIDRLRSLGIDMLEKPLELTPRAHAFNGGFRINERTETTLSGLYAIGETATGPHGADRLGGNQLAAGQVFGARAGVFASERAKTVGKVTMDQTQIKEECNRIYGIMGDRGGMRPQEIKDKIGGIMWRNCLTVRNERGLESCIHKLKKLRDEELPRMSIVSHEDLLTGLAIPNLLDVGQIVAYAALQRRESRGGHFREDYPDRDDKNWSRTININKNNLHLG